MVNPTLALGVFAVLAFLCAILLWPDHGILPRVLRLVRLSERVRIEDVLKQLHKLEYDRLPANPESVAGGTQMSRHQAARILQRVEELDFVSAVGTSFKLTDEGRAYALRIIRTHRLWERFLADRTGTRPEEWHGLAEFREHRLSERATENLASSLGHPLYDPHGDPIPTASGDMPAQSGFPLTSLRVGESAVITHLEDEPSKIYAELVGLGLGPMVPIERVEGPKGKVGFRAAGSERVVDAFVARNVTVDLSASSEGDTWAASLSDLPVGSSAVVLGIAPVCQGPARRRLLDLGLVPGTVVTARMTSAAGDPVAYDIRGALIALRKGQADLVQVDLSPSDVAPGAVTAGKAAG